MLFPIPVTVFIVFFLVAAVMLAGWTFTRFRNVGPRSLTGGFLVLLSALALIRGLPAFIDGVSAAGIPYAGDVAVFGLGLPTFTYFFLAGGWFMRSLLQFPGRLS